MTARYLSNTSLSSGSHSRFPDLGLLYTGSARTLSTLHLLVLLPLPVLLAAAQLRGPFSGCSWHSKDEIRMQPFRHAGTRPVDGVR
jgi:hypothetical protein